MKNCVPFTGRARRGRRPAHSLAGRWPVLAALAGGLLSGSASHAQSPAAPRANTPDVVPAYAQSILDGSVTFDPNVMPAGCATCGGGSPISSILPSSGGSSAGCACSGTDTCGSCGCKPGKSNAGCPLDSCPPNNCVLRFFHGVAACVCCPDPCYEPTWSTTANSAFFMDTVRPRTYTRLTWDADRHVTQTDRVEYLWAKTGGRGPKNFETNLNYDDLKLYQEAGSGNFSAFFESSYRSVYPTDNDHHANFGDLTAGTKSLLIDCELLQFGFQFKTYIPAGNAKTGLGTGHTSLEPSLLASIKVDPCTYIQTQVAYWFPIGGDRDYDGATWHYHLSLNHLCYKWSAFQLIGTAEINGWTFTDGLVTDPTAPNMAVRASNESYLTAGGGLRVVFCEDYDLGFGMTRSLTDDHFARELYRLEFRKRY